MAVMIESLIGILLFTVLIVSLTLKNPLTSVGDYPPAIREKCMELGLIENVNVNIKFTKSVSLTFTSSGCYDLHLQSWTSYPLFDMTFL
jgi:hypothetical protein